MPIPKEPYRIDWHDVALWVAIFGLGFASFLLAIGWRVNDSRIVTYHDRINVLSQRMIEVERRLNDLEKPIADQMRLKR
jgi:hypothetical protein